MIEKTQIYTAAIMLAIGLVLLLFFWWSHRKALTLPSENQDSQDKLIPYCIPSLVATILNKEREKGSPLTEEEVIFIRDSAPAVLLTDEMIKSMDEKRGYVDIDADNCWDAWQIARVDLQDIDENSA